MIFTLAGNTNPYYFDFLLLGLIIIGIGSILRYFKQPLIIAYILAGVLLGRHGFQIITDEKVITSMGEIGLILLMFFIGMDLDLPRLIKSWKAATIGTIIQIIASIFMVALIGLVFSWGWNRIILLGFVISLSSSAVVIKLLQDNKENHTTIGQSVISILLVQDILIVPMLIITQYLGGSVPSINDILLQLLGGFLLIAGIIWVLKHPQFTIPFEKQFEEDHEMQVFFALIICFGMAVATAFFGLSAALGAFVAGMIVHAAKSTEWFHDSLHAFRIIFVAIFFVSIGMLIDIGFIMDNWEIISLLLISVYLGNHFINSIVLHAFGRNWKYSLYGGALLAQIGELSFILVSGGYFSGIISEFDYQLTIIVISLTLLFSPLWIGTTVYLIEKTQKTEIHPKGINEVV
ncbi:MAG: cation:proton antiporter [Saprospiraceae bacterium]|nr:cation:proton antiporter [Saprospiraceae bacterium]